MSHLGKPNRLRATALLAALLAVALFLAGSGGATAASALGSGKNAAPVAAKKAQKAAKADSSAVPTGAVTGTASDGSAVTGTFTPKKFKAKNGQLWAHGRLAGTLDGKKFHKSVKLPVQSITGSGSTLAAGPSAAGSLQAASCDVLNLVLGPLDLNLLGLTVSLNQVVLDIIAVTGAGNLLGNLLCAVAGLLDGGPLAGLLGTLQNLLNQILGILNGLSL